MIDDMNYTSLRVREDRKMKLERAAIDISNITKRTVKWTDVANYLFENHLKEAVKDMKAKREDDS